MSGPPKRPRDPFLFTPIDVAAFWARVSGAEKQECWEWTGSVNDKGYGRFRGTGAHRVAYKLVCGPVPDDLMVLHECDNPGCCNPYHLKIGTARDNAQDAVKRGRNSAGERHGGTSLTADDVTYIRANPDRLKGVQLAEKFGVGRATISDIRNSKSWR
jgi:HNH endonuclease